jgi:uncharacterized repeat protein (TIGR03803 family)
MVTAMWCQFASLRAAPLVVAGTLIASPGVSIAASFEVLHTFTGPDGARPRGALIQTIDGFFYGTTWMGGRGQIGTVFRLTADGSFTVLHEFTGGTDGAFPAGSLIQATDGNFYGTTWRGGLSDYGTVFRMAPDGTMTIVHLFTYSTDGARPLAALIQASDGNLYGTTSIGGPFDQGTIFKMTLDGAVTVLHEFGSTEGDGANPEGALVEAADGDFYGTTESGGDWNGGMVFRMSPGGTLTELVAFAGHDGAAPLSELIQTSDGNLYGTTWGGGAVGYGIVFEMTPYGTGGGILHDFTGAGDGAYPTTALLQASDAKFYGTAYYGGGGSGCGLGCGTVFQVTLDGSFTILHEFTGDTDGALPDGALIQGSDGKFYGTAYSGGTGSRGVVFRLALP